MKILSLIIIVIFFAFKVYGHGTIIIQGVEHEKGEIDVKIYMDKKSFLKYWSRNCRPTRVWLLFQYIIQFY